MRSAGVIKKALLAVWCLLITAMVSQAARPMGGLEFTPESGISMELTNAYEDLPPYGFLPVRVNIKNGSPLPREWELRSDLNRGPFNSSTLTTRLAVPANAEQTFDLLLPLAAPSTSTSYTGTLNVMVRGYGILRPMASEFSSYSGRARLPYLGMGEALASNYWGVLKKEIEQDGTYSLEGSSLSLNFLPEDWKGLVCFGIILLADSEWKGLSTAQREAMLSWVAQGGHLIFAHEMVDPLGLPAQGVMGAGRIEYWPLGDGFTNRAKELLIAQKDSSLPEIFSQFSTKWPFAKSLGSPELPRTALIIFVILFGIIIGPVNLLWLAPSGNRHRLFWTTPIISISATVLLVLFIFLSEGLGGKGKRQVLEFYDAVNNRKIVWQDQVARTGVLLDSSFALDSSVAPFYLTLQGTKRGLRNGTFFTEGAQWGGDWFRSRALQGMALISVSPTRERLEVSTGSDGVPSARSNFADELQDVWFFGENETVWHAPMLAPGVSTALQPATTQQFSSWFDTQRKTVGPLLRSRANAMAAHPEQGKFFASRKQSSAIPTLNAIRWVNEPGLVVGQINP